MAKKLLTAKQKVFISCYLTHFNGKRAASQAGYKGNDNTLAVVASENLSKHNVKAEIERALTAYGMSSQEVLFHLAEIGRRAAKDGNRIKALELIAKTHGLFQPDRIDINFVGEIDFESLTDEQLQRIAAGADPGDVIGK